MALSDARPGGLADWDARPWQRHRLWITLTATNPGGTPATLAADLALDGQVGGGVGGARDDVSLAVPAHASASARLTLYVPESVHAVGIRTRATTPGAETRIAFAFECSDARFDPGEMGEAAARQLDAAFKTWLAQAADPPANPLGAVETARRVAGGAQDTVDVAWALRATMRSAGDVSSQVLLPGETPPVPVQPAARPPQVELRADGVAWLRLYPADANDAVQALAYARSLQSRVAAVAARRPAAWVVDLREQGGGGLWPTLAALSSLLGGPSVGASIGRDAQAAWIVERGAVRLAGGDPIVDLQLPPRAPFEGPVAVLIGPGTREDGEAIAVAFEGRPRTRFFGATTAGAADSHLRAHVLPDGETLRLLDARAADRNGVVYRGPITPDEPAASRPEGVGLPPEVTDWLLSQRGVH